MSEALTPQEIEAYNNGWRPTEEQRPKRRKRKSVDMAGVGEPQSLDLREQTARTDRANGQRFATSWGDSLRWCDPWKTWLTWDLKRWSFDHQRKVEFFAKRQTDSIWREVGRLLPDVGGEMASELVRFAKNTAAAKGIDNMLKLARSEPGIPVLPEQLDSHPDCFNVANGIIDLETGKLFPHDRKLLLTKLCPVEFHPAAECPLWLDTINKIFAHDADLVGFVRRLFGSSLVGTIVDHILAIFYGTGSNGKSLITETMLEIFGDYGGKAPSDLLLQKRNQTHPCEKADLFGKRLVFCVETDQGRSLSESTAKELTGGDTVTARRMQENFWSFKPSHTVVMATNHKPQVKGTDHAIWRRLRLCPFNQKFWDASRGESGPPELKADSTLKEKLRAEYPGILRWLVEACLEWRREGLGEPEQVRIATSEYRTNEDVLGEFFDAAILPIEGGKVKASELRTAYSEWCKQNNEKPCSNKRLGQYMSDKDVQRTVSNGVVYHDVCIVEGWKD